jgi:hypothetical protein
LFNVEDDILDKPYGGQCNEYRILMGQVTFNVEDDIWDKPYGGQCNEYRDYFDIA